MRSKLAIASFVLSLIPILIFLLKPSIIPLVLYSLSIIPLLVGIAALIVIRKNNLKGIWFAIFGIILGVIELILITVIYPRSVISAIQ